MQPVGPAYLRVTGTWLAPWSFHARFCAGLVEPMRTLALEALVQLARARGGGEAGMGWAGGAGGG